MRLWNGRNIIHRFITARPAAKSGIGLFFFVFFCLSARGWCVEEEAGMAALQTYLELEMFDRAAAIVDVLRQEFPDDPQWEYLNGVIAYKSKQPAKAREALREFIALRPEVPEPYYILGEISLEQKDTAAAKEYFSRYCELVPEDIDAYLKLGALSRQDIAARAEIIKDGRADSRFVKKLGFYGGCIPAQEPDAVKLVNGSSCNWSAMGVDFVYPVDLRGKSIILEVKGKTGGEKIELTFRNQSAKEYIPQMTVRPPKSLLTGWQRLQIVMEEDNASMDLSSVVHIGLEFGSATVQNPANSALFVKNIAIEAR